MDIQMTNEFQTINPANQEVLRTYELMSWDIVKLKIDKGQEQFQHWSKLSFPERASCFNTIAKLLRERKEKYAALITSEMGKPIVQAIAEIEKCAWVCEYYAKNAEAFLESTTIKTEFQKSYLVYQPLGVILQIMPWNFPFWQVFRFAAPALMAGNVTLLKHAPNVLGCAQAIEELFLDAGFPPETFQQLVIPVDWVQQILEDQSVQGVALTGSIQAGAAVGELAGKNIKRCVLELGGSDAFVVLEDANLEQAAKEAVLSRMHNTGQTCISAKRFIVVKNVAKEFKRLVLSEIEQLTIGEPTNSNTQLAVMARPDLIQNLERQVQKSVEMGAKLELEGGRKKGTNYYYPQLLSNIKKGMPAYEEELFGPTIAFFEVEDEKDAIRLVNDTIFGLGASVWSQNIQKAEELALQLEVGAVAINQLLKSDPRIPFGGIKRSGIGRELGKLGLLEFVNIKSVIIV